MSIKLGGTKHYPGNLLMGRDCVTWEGGGRLKVGLGPRKKVRQFGRSKIESSCPGVWMPGDDCMCGGPAPVGGNCEDRHASKGRNVAKCRARELINRTTGGVCCIIYRTGVVGGGKRGTVPVADMIIM